MSAKNKLLAAQKQDAERVLTKNKYMLPLITKKIGSVLEKKSVEISIKAREDGNALFSIFSSGMRSGKIQQKILSLYCRSIAFAPTNSKELALAFNNRSVFMLSMKEYESAMFDIDKACSLTKSNELKAKLYCRKVRCLKLLGLEADVAVEETKRFIALLEDSEHKEVKQKVQKQLQINMQLRKKTISIRELQFAKFDFPNIEWSKEVPCASSAVKLCYSKKYGRHVVATRDVKVGEILIVEDAYCCYPSTHNIHILCNHCFRLAFASIPCETCSYAMYCSEECKQVAWKKYHEEECVLNPLLWVDEQNRFFGKQFMYIRLFITIMKEGGINYLLKEIEAVDNCKDKRTKGFTGDIFDSQKFRAYYSLLHYKGNKKDREQFKILNQNFFSVVIQMVKIHTNLLENVDEKHYSFLEQLIFDLSYSSMINGNPAGGIGYCFCNVSDNTWTYMHEADCLQGRGGFISAFKNFINHSCIPNTEYFCGTGKVYVYSIKPIKKNEQIFLSYGPSIQNEVNDRQEFLWKQFFFKCECPACKNEWPVCKEPLISLSKEKVLNNDKVIKAITECGTTAEPGLTNTGMSAEIQEKGMKAIARVLNTMYQQGDNVHVSFVSLEWKRLFQTGVENSYIKESILVDETWMD